MPPADLPHDRSGYPPAAERSYDLCTRLLYGPGTWFEMCHEAATGDPAQAAVLVSQLAPGQDVNRALATRANWPGRSRLEISDDQGGGSGLSAARAAAAIVGVLVRAHEPDARLHLAATHWRRANVLPDLRLTGADILTGGPDEVAAAALRRLAVLTDDATQDSAVWGFLALLVRALRDTVPGPKRSIEVPVLFDRRATGGHGILRLELMDGGPSGLYPDPRSMMFLVADRQYADALDAAWQTMTKRLTGACVVWRLTTEDQPCDQVEGGSLGAAFAVALAELARPVPARLRARRLDRHCAVTAGLRPDGHLVEVSGTRNKLEEAARRGLRVVLAPPSPGNMPGERLMQAASVRYAADLPTAIRLTRTQLNRTFVALMAAVLVAVGGLVGGGVYAQRQAVHNRDQAIGTRLVGDVATLKSQDPASGLLLEALAVRLSGAGARAALVRDLMANRYIGRLPTSIDVRLCNEQQAWSPDGETVATADKATLTLWNVRSRRTVRTIQTRDSVTDCAFSPDGATLAVAAGDNLLLVTLAPVAEGPAVVIQGGVREVRYAGNGLLATSSAEGSVRLWSLARSGPPQLRSTVTVTANTGSPLAGSRLTFSPDSRTLAVTEHSGIALIDVTRPEAAHQVALLPGSAECSAFSPDSGTLAVGTLDGITELWDVRTPASPRRRGRTDPQPRLGLVLSSVAFTPDGQRMVTDGAGLGEVWGVNGDAAPQYLGQVSGGPHQVTGVALAPDGETVLVEDADGVITLWRTDSAKSLPVLATLPMSQTGVSGVAFPHTTTPQLAMTANDGLTTLWDVSDPRNPVKSRSNGIAHSGGSAGSYFGAADTQFSPDGSRFAVLDYQNYQTIDVWQITTAGEFRQTSVVRAPAGAKIKPLGLSSSGILLTTNPDDKQALSSMFATDGAARLIGRLPAHADTAAFAPDGRRLVTRARDGTIAWWDITTPSHPAKLAQRSIRVGGGPAPVAYANDGRLTIATESGAPGTLIDTTDPTAPVVLGVRPGLDGGAAGDAAIIDGHLLVLSTLGAVRLWDVTDPASATLLTEFDVGRNGDGVISGRAAVSPSGVLAAAQLGDVPQAYYTGVATIRLWDLAAIREILNDPVGAACRVAGGDLSPEVWRRYAPELRVRPICS